MRNKRYFSYIIRFLLTVCLVVGMWNSPAGVLEAEAAGETITSASCRLTDGATVQFSANLSGVPASDDGMLYLYQLKTYQYSIPSGAQPIASCGVAANAVVSFPLGGREAGGRLYAKYALAAKQGGKVVMLGTPQYITNPEVLATNNHRTDRPAKTTISAELTNLEINGSGTGNVPPSQTKRTIQVLCKGGNAVTNPKASGGSHKVKHYYYMLNAANDSGIEGLVRDMTNYAANSNGQDFIIGNEVNERIWNYLAWTDWNNYINEYAQVLRVCYTAIKSTNAQARVYVSIDQNWDRNRLTGNSEYYTYLDGADFLSMLASSINAGGNIDWDLAIHPYTVPLTYAKFWDLSGVSGGDYYARQVNENQMMSFQNMTLASGFMKQPGMLNRSGNVRDIIINEIGISNAQGEDVQAAALCAAYYAFSKNPAITQFMYLSSAGYGVDSTLTPHAQRALDAMGTGAEGEYMNWAKSYIGISDWSQVIR